jgi:hypothetical protein
MLPEIEVVHPDVDPTLPPQLFRLASELSRGGVARWILLRRFRASPTVVLTFGLLEIGRSGPAVIGVEPSTGRVHSVVAGGHPHLVNSSVDHFIEVARRVTGRFPFYSAADQDAEVDTPPPSGCGVAHRAGNAVRSIIAEVDPPAIAQGTFWGELVDDIRMGDYATEDILSA